MASSVLYPPIVEDFSPAFIAGSNSTCKIYFSLSKFNASTDFTSAQFTVLKQNSGVNMVNKRVNGENRYRNTGIVLNVPVTKVEDKENLYYIEVLNEDILGGWEIGSIYNIQIRLSMIDFDETIGQSAWLNTFANQFSEWSTLVTVKSIGDINFTVPNYSLNNVFGYAEATANELNFTAVFNSADSSEKLYSYRVYLYDENGELLEDSGMIYLKKFYDSNQFNYVFKTEPNNNTKYIVKIHYETINKYENDFIINCLIQYDELDTVNIEIITVENDAEGLIYDTTISQEEEEGRVRLQIVAAADEDYSGQLMIRRADSRDNFKVWTDIKLLDGSDLLSIVYDYTIESGVWYKYGIQKYEKVNNTIKRGPLNTTENPIIRDFNYSFLLGENNQQLKLQFDNGVDSLKLNVQDNIVATLGGTYPLVARIGASNYKSFNLSGLISFNMDENNLFLSKEDIYQFEEISNLYNEYNNRKGISLYDYTYEREFREKVMEFLSDGKVKMFKSPTEGNILIYLNNISLSPNKSLSRLVSSFTSTATEVAKNTIDNQIKYNLLQI